MWWRAEQLSRTDGYRILKKILVVVVVVALAAGFFGLDLHRALTLESLKASREQFETWRAASPFLVAAGFFAIYVLVTSLSLPGAAVMTLAAGALFGLWWGTLIVSFASSIGATLAFLVARFLLRDTVQQRFGDRLKAINDGMAREGALYLLT